MSETQLNQLFEKIGAMTQAMTDLRCELTEFKNEVREDLKPLSRFRYKIVGAASLLGFIGGLSGMLVRHLLS